MEFSFRKWFEAAAAPTPGNPTPGATSAGPDDKALEDAETKVADAVSKQPAGAADPAKVAKDVAAQTNLSRPEHVGRLTAYAQGILGAAMKAKMKKKMKK